MKHLIISFGICLLAGTLTYCSSNLPLEEISNQDLSDASQEQQSARYYVKEDGALCFHSVEDYYSVVDSLVNLSSTDYQDWAKRNRFNSYRSTIEPIIDEIQNAQEENSPMLTTLLNKYAKYVYLDQDSIVRPLIQSASYRSIVNQDGVFYMNNIKNVVDDKYIYADTNSTSPIKHLYIEPQTQTKSDNEKITYNELVYENTSHDRRVLARCYQLKNIVSTDAQGNFYACIQLELEFHGRKKRKWYLYKTAYTVEDIHAIFCNVPVTVKPDGTLGSLSATYAFDHDGMDRIGEAKTGTITYNIGAVVKNYTTPITRAKCIHFLVKSRGTHPEGLGYNYYNGKYYQGDYVGSGRCPIHGTINYK